MVGISGSTVFRLTFDIHVSDTMSSNKSGSLGDSVSCYAEDQMIVEFVKHLGWLCDSLRYIVELVFVENMGVNVAFEELG